MKYNTHSISCSIGGRPRRKVYMVERILRNEMNCISIINIHDVSWPIYKIYFFTSNGNINLNKKGFGFY
jgi:hypothetical protein